VSDGDEADKDADTPAAGVQTMAVAQPSIDEWIVAAARRIADAIPPPPPTAQPLSIPPSPTLNATQEAPAGQTSPDLRGDWPAPPVEPALATAIDDELAATTQALAAEPRADELRRDTPAPSLAETAPSPAASAPPVIAASAPPALAVHEVRPAARPHTWSGLLQGPWTWRRAARLAGLAVAAYFAVILSLIVIYRFINPPTTTLIAYQWLTGTKIEQDWVPIENISSNLLRAVVVSEDWGFCDHYGIDLVAIEAALEQAGEGKMVRGASTISMQVIKNLFLSQSKSFLRKAVEIPLTFAAEAVWPKSRMLEIYLNIAEWGPGVFGAQAAARHHFSKPASRLTEREAALLAAALPNPILRDAGDPSTRTARKASVIQSRMRAAGPVADCAMTGRQRTSSAAADDEPASTSGWATTVKKRAGARQGL
jgi:monofunctional biosynthetic peptidoglycan transglycosylase